MVNSYWTVFWGNSNKSFLFVTGKKIPKDEFPEKTLVINQRQYVDNLVCSVTSVFGQQRIQVIQKHTDQEMWNFIPCT